MKSILTILFLFTTLICFSQSIKTKQVDQNMNGNSFHPYGARWGHDSVYFKNIPIYPIPDSITFFGNSITSGQNAASGDSAYTSRIQSLFSLTGVSKSLGGSGVWYATSQANDYIDPGYNNMTSVMVGFNDIRRQTDYRLTLNKIINGHMSIFGAHFLKSFVNAGNGAGVTRYGGTWATGYSSQLVGGRANDAGAYTGQVDDSITYVFTDNNVMVQMIYGDGITEVHSNSFEIYIDNVLQRTASLKYGTDGVSDGSNSNTRIPGAFFYTGLEYGSHTIKLINKEAHNMIVDFFGHLVDLNNAYPLLIFHAPKMDATGYASSPANATDALIDSVNAKIDSLVASLPPGYPVFVVPTNTHYIATTSSGLDSDHIHPNNRGHGQIFEAMLDVFPSLNHTPVSISNQSIFWSGRPRVKDSSGVIRMLSYLGEGGGGGGVNTMAAVGSSPNANGATILGSTLTLQPASITHPGVVSNTTQTFNGDKTINGGIQIQGALSAPAGAGLEIEYSGGLGYISAYNRTGAAWLPLRLRGDVITFQNNGSTKLTINSSDITSAVDVIVPDEVYDATNWNGSLEVPTKNAIRDKIESMSSTTVSLTKSLTLEIPTSSENFGIWRTKVAITIDSVSAVLVGSSSPSVTYNIKFGSDRTSGTNLFESDQAVTNTTTGTIGNTGFNDQTVPANNHIWFITSAQSGTVVQIEITIYYHED